MPHRDKTTYDPSESLLLQLVEHMGPCRDMRCVLVKSSRLFAGAFAPFDVFGVAISDAEQQRWRALPIENPLGEHWGGLRLVDLEQSQDMEGLADVSGRDLTLTASRLPDLDHLLNKQDGPIFLTRADDPELVDAFSENFGLRLACLAGSNWIRPLGGRGWLFLGSREHKAWTQPQLKELHAAIRVTARMAVYPGMLQAVRKHEHLSQSLRRNLVHDLKSPITVIKGYAQTVLASDERRVREEFLHGIIELAERLVEDLSDVLAPLEAMWTPKVEELDISALLNKVVQAERHTDRGRSHQIMLEGASSPVYIRGDLRKLRRVLENLLSNAVKYSPGQNKRVWIALACAQEHVTISFRDEGIGMDAGQLKEALDGAGRVVDPKFGIEGSGFGLDSCRRILEAHDGHLVGESKLGAGTTFSAVLPVRGPADRQAEAEIAWE